MATEPINFEKISCYAQSQVEAEFIYKEIFEDHCYDLPNASISPFIIDAGANIGLMSLYMKQRYPSSKILAFEPAPDTFDILRRNLDLHNAGDLTYYPKLPGNSTLVPEEKQHIYGEAVRVHGQEAVDQLFGDTFKTAQEVDVKLQRLSHFLHNRSGIEAIDLLKIDVEGAELDVLRGLDDVHWCLIQNIILEGCEASGTRATIEELLKSKGFSFTREAAAWAPRDFYMLRAYRKVLVPMREQINPGLCTLPVGYDGEDGEWAVALGQDEGCTR
ncbi:hypothetical protein N7532_004787 [Penicillium argentinense]|uniref:Methyltransferase FkbM domain-containing protein n=1 Tax=Penicillium argentinense TaxID=1131581 RepID=A0A9W9FPY7_9EURO|nr:uncharacterized protein N7532_004787 [Penicillium argentinense]KAJ5104258.1 hypothetical protein N7532_004787 [Penicillium argentinense]